MTDLDLDKLEADAKAAHADESDWSWFTEWLDGYGYGSKEMATHIDNTAPPKFLALIERLRAAEAKIEAVREICADPKVFAGNIRDTCLEALGEES